MTADQHQFRLVAPTVSGPLRPELQALITAIGLYRIHVDSHLFFDVQARAVAAAQRALVAACVPRAGIG